MVIYTVYYHKRMATMHNGIVAAAPELPHTYIGANKDSLASGNIIYSDGIAQALQGQAGYTLAGAAPVENYVSMNAAYSTDQMHLMYDTLLSKFPNHPPLDFNGVKDGDNVLFSYFFQNVRLTKSFRSSFTRIHEDGETYRAIEYIPSDKDSSVSFYKNGNTFQMTIDMNRDQELVMIKAEPKALDSIINALPGQALSDNPLRLNKANLSATESIIFPETDLSLVKDYNKTEFTNAAELSKYKIIEERIKLKTSVAETRLEERKKYDRPGSYIFSPPYLFYLERKGHQKPYITVYTRNTELLLPEKNQKGYPL